MRFASSLLLAGFLAMVLVTASPAQAGTWRVQAETYIDSHNVFPDDLSVLDGVLYGLDYPGEWTRYALPALEAGRYAVVVKCWGPLQTPFHLQVVLEGPQTSSQTVDLNFIGRGSCGTWGGEPVLVAGSDGLQFAGDTTTVTLLYVSGTALQCDWLEFSPVTGVAPQSWSAVKQLFR